MSHESNRDTYYNNSGYPDVQYAAGPPPQPGGGALNQPPPDHGAPGPWGAPAAPAAHTYGYRCDFPPPAPGGVSFGGPGVSYPYAFDPSVPPPPFICPPPGRFPPPDPGGPAGAPSAPAPEYPYPHNPAANYSSGAQGNRYEYQQTAARHQYDYRGYREGAGAPFAPRGSGPERSPGGAPPRPVEDEDARQRRLDQQWLTEFLQTRAGDPERAPPERRPQVSVGEMKEALYAAARLLPELSAACEALRAAAEDQAAWTERYAAALRVKEELQEKLQILGDEERVSDLKAKLLRIASRRSRRLRARKLRQLEEAHREERSAQREAEIDKWRMKKIHQVEEKKKEQELKLAADAVLCEVRKKQADVKRMQDVLRSLEKLRKLRKEAASRKGIFTDQESEETFNSHLERLRVVIRKRTAVYATEETALKVMLEGEQEEERRREREKRQKKEREKLLQRRRQMDGVLFGDEAPCAEVLRPFREYYTQAERSLHALLQIRTEWDIFLVAADHPEGSAVPQAWVVPDPPSDPSWASALQGADDGGANQETSAPLGT